MIKKLIVPLLLFALLGIGLLIVAGFGFHWHVALKKPTQPLAFSHDTHIERVGLSCQQCHIEAHRSIRAGIPAVSVCVDCHQKAAADRPEIKRLLAYWRDKEPIPWNKVHRLDWHVHFTHKRHIKAGIDCAVCHGEVRAMDTVRPVRTLSMGWCVTCHRENNAATDCLTCHK